MVYDFNKVLIHKIIIISNNIKQEKIDLDQKKRECIQFFVVFGFKSVRSHLYGIILLKNLLEKLVCLTYEVEKTDL